MAPDYDAWYTTLMGAYVDKVEKRMIHELVSNIQRGERVLDVGCGTGIYSALVAKLGAKVTGLDFSKGMIRHASEKAGSNKIIKDIKFVLADAEELPFQKNIFDACINISSIEQIPNPVKAIQEMKRVVKQGGLVIVAVLNKLSIWALIRRIKARIKKKSTYELQKFFTLFELKNLMRKAGFKLKEIDFKGGVLAPPNSPPFVIKIFDLFETNKRVLSSLGLFGAFIAISSINE